MAINGLLLTILTRSYEIVYRHGYVGLSFISLIETASLSLFPLPTMFFVFTFGGILNPFLVGIISGLGAGVGSISGYIFGRGFKDIAEKKYGRRLEKTRINFDKYKGFWWIIIVNITPLPEGLISLFCGVVHYDFKKFFVAALVGKIIYSLILAYGGYYGVNWLLDLFQFNLPPLV